MPRVDDFGDVMIHDGDFSEVTNAGRLEQSRIFIVLSHWWRNSSSDQY